MPAPLDVALVEVADDDLLPRGDPRRGVDDQLVAVEGELNDRVRLAAVVRHPFSKACLQHYQTVIQPCMWFMEEPGQFTVGQTAQSLTCSIIEKPHTGPVG